MHCPFCSAVDTKVIDSRLVGEGSSVRRRRQCLVCNERFTTFEVAELVMPRVVKSNDVREPFNEEKLRSGMLKALEKRPVSADDVEMALNHIKSYLRGLGEREVPSKMIGNLVMEQLKKLDKVAISASPLSTAVSKISKSLAKRSPAYRIESMQDEMYMARAMKLAQRGRFTTHPNPNVGCVIVKDGEIVGEGFHYRAGEPHAEVHALRMAGEKARGATAYVTLEPCSHHGRTPPCCEALIAAGVSRVVAAMQDPNPQVAGRGLYRLQQEGIDVSHGLMMQDAEAINKGFLKRMRTGFPYIQLKLGASLDGRTAMANGESQWITSPQARRDVQRLRAQSHAILTSSETVLADDPAMTVRWNELNADTQALYPQENLRQPLRIVIDSQNRVTPEHRIVQQPGETWIARTKEDSRDWPESVRSIMVPEHNGHLDLVVLMMLLGKQQVNSIWVEAGPTLAGALLQAGLVDELIVYVAPKLLGSDARGLFVLPGLEKLADAPQLKFSEIRPVGPDVCLHLTTA